jgi:hypothetical protein
MPTFAQARRSQQRRMQRIERCAVLEARRAMVYRKGELNKHTIDRSWLHQVALPARRCRGPAYQTIDSFCKDDGKPVKFDLVPDNIFGIDGPKGVTFFALECENENTVETSQYKRNSTKRKMLGYRAISQRVGGVPLYTRHWGIPNLMVMFVAAATAHVERMKSTLSNIVGAKGSQQFLSALPTSCTTSRRTGRRSRRMISSVRGNVLATSPIPWPNRSPRQHL